MAVNEPHFECPICSTKFDKKDFKFLLEMLEGKIRNLDSPLVTDYSATEKERLISIYDHIRYMYLRLRPKSNMMDSQNLILDENNKDY